MGTTSKKSKKNEVFSNYQKQALVLLGLSLIIYTACQFDATKNLLVPTEEKVGPKRGTDIKMRDSTLNRFH